MKSNVYRVGVDVGSTTLKVIVLDHANQVVYKAYQRHKTDINGILAGELNKVSNRFPDAVFAITITGSAGMGISERTGITFVQEIVASVEVINRLYPHVKTMIDLGGEDAKMVFFSLGKQPDIRMNGSCAGGTGAFIDQMADLMNISVEQLNKEALNYEKIYPIASRCGVFAKTDVQNLICRNVPVADISASILHTVALQCITSLARGYDIEPDVLCIGGPLTFIPALRNSFKDLLKLSDTDLVLPENSEYFPALGCAMLADPHHAVDNILRWVQRLNTSPTDRKDVLPVLFPNESAYNEWKKSRNIKQFTNWKWEKNKHADCFLGIDSGSTTTKILVMAEDSSIVYSFYGSNEGNPLKKAIEGLAGFYQKAEKEGISFRFLSSAVTGYGEDLIKSALNLDYGIVETMAHLAGAQFVDPLVSFVLDIGGQDIKSIFTREGVISNIELNEACSSGCGSFLQNFSATMNMDLNQFSREACMSQCPSDLGSRCTVFMNSKVKQSLREGASLGDISAGLAYSVVRNCLFKVLKITNLNTLGDHIVVQGGTFRNDAVYRALELESGKAISSTDHPELMGAFGAALYARKMWKVNHTSNTPNGIPALPEVDKIETRELQCKGCTNQCTVLRFKFENGNISYAGNKCEKIFYNKAVSHSKGYNAFDSKNEILFSRELSGQEKERNLTIGIPRVLNMFENYPFWYTLFTECGLSVRLSPESTLSLYQSGVGSIMSENICFPAKLVHGHILALMNQKVDRIFYPIVPLEDKEFGCSNNSFNCPVVSGYPDVVRSSIDPARHNIPFDKPVINFSNQKALEKGCRQYLLSLGVPASVFKSAFAKAMAERKSTNEQIIIAQKARLDEAIKENRLVFVVAGRPYHTDPLIHQKVGQILSDLGVDVFTDDVFRKSFNKGFGKLNIVSQWSYPNRVVQAAMEVARLPQNVQLIQLNSFGCGPDSFFMDETGDILKHAGKNHTILRLDEIASPGSIRLRLRSLIESLKAVGAGSNLSTDDYKGYNTIYKKEDRRKTILAPWLADFFSPFLPAVAELAGYKLVNMPRTSRSSVDEGLKYGHNEVCYPSTLILGDIISTLKSGKYNLDDVVVAITQTGGQCRATNYISQIKAGLKNAGFATIPVLAVGAGSIQNEQDAFKVPILKILNISMYAVLYADAIQQMYSSTVVREKKKGQAREIFDFYIEEGIKAVEKNNHTILLELLRQAVADYNQVDIYGINYTRIGLIGEIYVKYNNYGQAHITEWLRSKGMEVATPPIQDFLMQYFVNSRVNEENRLNNVSLGERVVRSVFWKYMNIRINKIENIVSKYRFYHPTESIFKKAEYASEILDPVNQFGEGWMIAAEVACFARQGINKVVCLQPFGCIANHVVAKGIEKRLRSHYPNMNLLYLDIDGGMAEVNLQNRLHFMMQE